MKKLLLAAVMALIVSPVLAGPTITLPDGADAYWAINSATDNADARIVFEDSAAGNTFGLFDKANPANKLPVFLGSDDTGDKAVVTILDSAPGSVTFRSLDLDGPAIVGTSTFAANAFGYFVTTPTGATIYSDTLLNPGQIDHMSADVLLPGAEYQLNWTGGENNFRFLVVNVESVHPIPNVTVPAPGAILLGSIGVSIVGWMRRRRVM